MTLYDEYVKRCNEPSDINQHLPTLVKYAKKCDSAIELGVRGVVSTWALAYGLNDANKETFLYLVDINSYDVSKLLQIKHANLQIRTFICNDLEFTITRDFDLCFIDTWHVYGQLKRELAKFAPHTNKYIILHDTELDGVHGEEIRSGRSPEQIQEISNRTGIPVEEITKGIQPAINEFLEDNISWEVAEVFTNNNGLTILQRKC